MTIQFKVIKEKTISSTTDEGTLYITGIANSGLEDLVGDTVTQQALQQIVEQATNHNLHLDHDTSIQGVLGPITEAELVDEGARIKARIIEERRDLIEPLLEQDVKLGLSISGVAESTNGDDNLLDKWDLTEISITPVPCDQATMGSVHIAKSFHELVDETKNIPPANNTISDTISEQSTSNATSDDVKEEDIMTIEVKEINVEYNTSEEYKEDEGDEENNTIPVDDDTNKEFAESTKESNDTTEESVKNKEANGDENMAEEEVTYTTQDDVISLINTAFNEKQEEFLETLREEIKNEYEANVAAQEERINALEQAVEALKEEPKPADEEEKADDEEEVEIDEEEEEKSFETQMNAYFKKLLGVNYNEPSFQYDETKNKKDTTSKGATPKEIAALIAGQK